MSADARIAELNLQLPPAPQPGGNYTPMVIVGEMAYVSGHGPVMPDGTMITGRVGDQLTEEEGQQAARQVGLTILASLREHLGDLKRVERVVVQRPAQSVRTRLPGTTSTVPSSNRT